MKEALVKIGDSVAKWKHEREVGGGWTRRVLSARLLLINTKLFADKDSSSIIRPPYLSFVIRLCTILFFETSLLAGGLGVAFARPSFFRSGCYSFTSHVYILPVDSVHVVTVSRVPRCKRAVTAEPIALERRVDRVVDLSLIGK